MEIEKAREFVRHNHRAVFHTRRKDGSPQLSPVTSGVDESGRVIVSSREPAAKTRNVRRDPRVSLCVFGDGFFGEWVQIDGTAEVISLPEAMDGLIDYYRSISGEHPDWPEYREAMLKQGKSLLRITPQSWSPIATGGFPAHLA